MYTSQILQRTCVFLNAAVAVQPALKYGAYLLSRFRSTIGAAGLNFSVRDGKRCGPGAIGTRIFYVTPWVGGVLPLWGGILWSHGR